MVIHCLWVVGKSKGNGFSTVLLEEVERTALEAGFKGVAAVTSRGNWLVDAGVMIRRGYRGVDTAPTGFDLLVRSFDDTTRQPRFCGDWDRKLRAKGDGLVVYRSGQCPYLDDAANHAAAFAAETGLRVEEVWLRSAEDVRRWSPTPYGVFALVLNGRLLAYHYLLKKQIAAAVEKLAQVT